MLHRFADIHTHIEGQNKSILSIPAEGVERIVLSNQALLASHRQCYSLQLHPWYLQNETDIEKFRNTAITHGGDPQFIAIGECGLDPLCNTPLELQHQAFVVTLQTARLLHKPVIVHCVKLWTEVIRDVHSIFPELKNQPEAWQQWPVVIHGFRKGPDLARQLLRAGLSISLGQHFHPQITEVVPPCRLYHETDGNGL